MLMEENHGKDGLTYLRVEGEGYEKPTSNLKNVRHLPNHGEHLFSISTEVKIRYNMFKGQKMGFRSDTGIIFSKCSGTS